MERRGRAEVFRLLLCWLMVGPVPAQVRHPLPVLWMENLTAGVGPAVRLALQDLKKQPEPLGNYEIQLQLLDSQCDLAKSLKALFDTMWAGPQYLLVLGGVCPSVTPLIARSLPALNLVQVSFADSSLSLANRRWYGNLFSTMPSDRALNQATVKLLQRYRWTRVSILTQETPRFSQMKKDLLRQLLKANVQVVYTESLSEDVCSSMRRLKDQDVRIFIGQFEEESASDVFCCAYRLNLFGARYQWLVVDGGAAGWQLGWQETGCRADSLLVAAEGSIRLQVRQLGSSNAAGVSGRTPQNYQDSYLRQLVQEGGRFSPLHAFAYDTVWVAAKALGQVMEAVKHRQKYGVHRNVAVREEELQKMLLEAVKKTQFEGVTGPVFFRNGERMTSIELIQFQGGGGVLVGHFSTSSLQLRLLNQLLKFKGLGPPRDRTEVREQRRGVSLRLYVAAASAAAVTIVITLSVLSFVLLHRLWLRTTGGSQDELLLVGVLLSSSWVLISGLDGASVSDRTFEILCSVQLWTLMVGHSVEVSLLLCRTWTVYLLGVQQRRRVQPPGRTALWILLLDVFVLSSWQILDPLRREVLQHRSETDPADQDAVLRPYSERCSSMNLELWLTLVYGYKGPLLGLGCFLSWSIRSVQVDLPVCIKQLTLTVFAVTAFSVSGASASLLTSHDPPLHFCLSSVLVLCCNIWILGFLFGPKVWYMWTGSELPPSELQGEATEEEDDEDQLSRLNQELKSRTAQLDVEIQTITMKLSETSECEILHDVMRTADIGEVRSVSWTHEDQVCADRKPPRPDDINSPEHMRRRLSMQLPILHHSYLPVVGGVRSSSSSQFGSHDITWDSAL